jgi:hypothetical protein
MRRNHANYVPRAVTARTENCWIAVRPSLRVLSKRLLRIIIDFKRQVLPEDLTKNWLKLADAIILLQQLHALHRIAEDVGGAHDCNVTPM